MFSARFGPIGKELDEKMAAAAGRSPRMGSESGQYSFEGILQEGTVRHGLAEDA